MASFSQNPKHLVHSISLNCLGFAWLRSASRGAVRGTDESRELTLAGSISARLFGDGDDRERQELSAAVKAMQKMILSARQALSPIPDREPRFFVLSTAIAQASSRFFIVASEPWPVLSLHGLRFV